ncbi:MAG: hypothetical protein GY822_01230 [Deltaproteobacteria bacterium]|nr:hypothetical protein [Deltaproteobacteria bacterium]
MGCFLLLASVLTLQMACDSAPPVEEDDAGNRPPPLPIVLDAGTIDSGVVVIVDAGPTILDAGSSADAGKRPLIGPPNGFSPNAAGRASSSQHQVQFSVGAPLPRGTAESPNHRLILTPQRGPATP